MRREIIKNHLLGFKNEISKAKSGGKDTFFTWFNSAKDTDASFVRGAWDFAFHISLPILKYVDNPETKTILEIGYGGGRILAAASRHFAKVIGVDIHEEKLFVETELKKRGIKNAVLLKGNGSNISTRSSSVDIVYSFIVLQHIEKMELFRKYFKETFRILKPGGVAILYFARYCRFSKGRSSLLLYWLDNLLELILLRRGFIEVPSQVNDVNLIVSVNYVKNLSEKIGFQVKGLVVSRIRVPDGINLYGGQHGVVIRKPL